jgi:hypothetical protein
MIDRVKQLHYDEGTGRLTDDTGWMNIPAVEQTRVGTELRALFSAQTTSQFVVVRSEAPNGTTLEVCPDLVIPSSVVQATSNENRMNSLAGEDGVIDSGGYSKCKVPLLAAGHRHGFIAAVTTAFAKHFPLALRPQHFWLMILQAVATHVDLNAEELRKKWVAHDGKRELRVRCDDFVKGRSNPWETVVEGRSDSFANQIAKNLVAGASDVLNPSFTGAQTTPAERIAQQITIMDVCKSYFSYKCCTMCGFPSITLEGSPGDWALLRGQAEQLLGQQCEPAFAAKWSAALLPVLDRFVAASATGEVDAQFWNSMCKRGGTTGSGSCTWFNGWMNTLFPYINRKPNMYCTPYSSSQGYVTEGRHEKFYSMMERAPAGVQGPDCQDFPSGVSEAPVLWDYLGEEIKLKFVSGFVGATQDPETLTISPHVGWFVARDSGDSSGIGERKQQGIMSPTTTQVSPTSQADGAEISGIWHVTGQGMQCGSYSYLVRAEFTAQGEMRTTQICSTNGTALSVALSGSGHIWFSDGTTSATDLHNGAVLNQSHGKITKMGNGQWKWEGQWLRADGSDSGTFASQKVDDGSAQRFQQQQYPTKIHLSAALRRLLDGAIRKS